MVTRWDPFRDLVTIQDELNRLFGRTYGATSEGGQDVPAGAWAPPMDIHETADSFVIDVELPGVDARDVDISVEENTLALRGDRDAPHEGEDEQYHRVERRYGPFARSVVLPPTADTEAIEAAFDRGVLTITVRKAEQAKPRRIEVKAKG